MSEKLERDLEFLFRSGKEINSSESLKWLNLIVRSSRKELLMVYPSLLEPHLVTLSGVPELLDRMLLRSFYNSSVLCKDKGLVFYKRDEGMWVFRHNDNGEWMIADGVYSSELRHEIGTILLSNEVAVEGDYDKLLLDEIDKSDLDSTLKKNLREAEVMDCEVHNSTYSYMYLKLRVGSLSRTELQKDLAQECVYEVFYGKKKNGLVICEITRIWGQATDRRRLRKESDIRYIHSLIEKKSEEWENRLS